MAQQDVIDTPKLLLSFALGVLVTIALVIAVQALYLAGQQYENDRKNLSRPPAEITDVMGAQREDLAAAKVLSKGAGGKPEKVQIPIDLAMKYVVKEGR